MTLISSTFLRLRIHERLTTWRRILLPQLMRVSIKGTSINDRSPANICKVLVALQYQQPLSQAQWQSKTLKWSLLSTKAWPRWVEGKVNRTTTLNCSSIYQTCLKIPLKLTSLQTDLRAAFVMIITAGVAAAARRNLRSMTMLRTRPSYLWRTMASNTS